MMRLKPAVIVALALASCIASSLYIFVHMLTSSVKISMLCSRYGGYTEQRLLEEGAERWAQETGNKNPRIECIDSNTNNIYEIYKNSLVNHSHEIDVFSLDNFMLSMLENHFISLYPCTGQTPCIDDAKEINQHLPLIIDSSKTADGKLIGLPWFLDFGLLYYNKDLLKDHNIPSTWQELVTTVQEVRERVHGKINPRDEDVWGFVWQGKAYEGLTCNALEWIYSFGGRIENNGKITIGDGDQGNNQKAIEAIISAASWVKGETKANGDKISPISPESVLNGTETETRDIFKSGNTIFMRDWPYAWHIVNAMFSPVRGRVGVTILPKGEPPYGRHASTRGGFLLAVSRYSNHQEEAVDLVRYLASPREQRERAKKGPLLPTIESLYREEEILDQDFFDQLNKSLGKTVYHDLINLVKSDAFMVERPWRMTGVRYNGVSRAFWQAVHNALSAQDEFFKKDDIKIKIEKDLESLQNRLNNISHDQHWQRHT